MATRKPPKTAFKKGQSGNPTGRKKGVPNKATQEGREFARELVGSATYRQQLQAKLEAGTLNPTLEVMLWNYAYGKPKETLHVEGGLEVLRVVIES